jgi:hypothetical protein
MRNITLSIGSSGTVAAIYDDEMAALLGEGQARIQRASHVEPTPDGQWTADIIGGPLLGPYPLRAQALAAEVEWLQGKMF